MDRPALGQCGHVPAWCLRARLSYFPHDLLRTSWLPMLLWNTLGQRKLYPLTTPRSAIECRSRLSPRWRGLRSPEALNLVEGSERETLPPAGSSLAYCNLPIVEKVMKLLHSQGIALLGASGGRKGGHVLCWMLICFSQF